ncbi:30S ribosomal protein S3 [Culicoidibacter larvae]|uniref:Small ribosomal subunit protein uS3 n=1 Tax=Culicoidibacter larvae TaxID=2579976 RepID=A0A5R8QIZ2_9FIRM|nr:30S ribosomal protein S3 [Culicoidibacter larvae]TLG77423.1 30S ribosomal protein S3 [Culicoidibacter larvae]
MGQKVSPIGLRVGIIRDWESRWYADKDYATFLHEDIKIRDFIFNKLKRADVSQIEIERKDGNRVNITIHTAKPGFVIGKGGADIERLRAEVKKLVNREVFIDIVEIKNPDLVARLVARRIADQLERRVSFRIAQKRAIQSTMRAGAKGIKTAVSGRLGGADMARTEGYSEGNVPLQTLRADIDYSHEEADTTYGKMGVKVWIYKGEILPTKKNNK